jgi:hypothetical protein
LLIGFSPCSVLPTLVQTSSSVQGSGVSSNLEEEGLSFFIPVQIPISISHAAFPTFICITAAPACFKTVYFLVKACLALTSPRPQQHHVP